MTSSPTAAPAVSSLCTDTDELYTRTGPQQLVVDGVTTGILVDDLVISSP